MIEANVTSVKESLDTLKTDFKSQTDDVVKAAAERFDKTDQAIKTVSDQLASIDKELAVLDERVRALQDELKK